MSVDSWWIFSLFIKMKFTAVCFFGREQTYKPGIDATVFCRFFKANSEDTFPCTFQLFALSLEERPHAAVQVSRMLSRCGRQTDLTDMSLAEGVTFIFSLGSPSKWDICLLNKKRHLKWRNKSCPKCEKCTLSSFFKDKSAVTNYLLHRLCCSLEIFNDEHKLMIASERLIAQAEIIHGNF